MGTISRDDIVQIPADGTLAVFEAADVSPLGQDVFARHRPEMHFMLVRHGRLAARSSIWTRQTPCLDGKPLGVIGHYAAADLDAGVAILRHAMSRLAAMERPRIVGPMDGNTWRAYRLVVDGGREPAFFMEPQNPPDWPAHFTAAGFAVLAKYYSGLNRDLSAIDPRVPAALERFVATGGRIRHIDLNRFEQELGAIHELSLESFAQNYLYTPIPRDEFIRMYQSFKGLIRPELVLLAEQENRLIGFMFGVPDLLQAQRGERLNTVIAKTLAVKPGRSGAGLGSVLMDQFQQSARRLGFTRVIHALMHENNRSMKISARYGNTIRQYALFAARVAP